MFWARRSIGRSHLPGILLVLAALLLFADISFSGAGRSGAAAQGAQRSSSGTRRPRVQINPDFVPDVGEMDPRLADALNAFGSSRYDECRKLAEDLIVGRGLRTPPTDSTRAECVGIVILSHLQQGDFDAAREAAERLRSVSPDVCQDLLQQANREERDYNAEVSRLQQIVATTDNPEVGARAQSRTSHVHHMYGRLGLAEKSYRKVVDDHPQAAEAPTALVQLAGIQYRVGRTEDAVKTYWEAIWVAPESPDAVGRVTTMEWLAWRAATPDYARQLGKAVADQAADSELASTACQHLFELASAEGRVQYGETRATFESIASAHPDTQVSDTARYLIGRLYAAEGQYEAAEKAWALLMAERPKARMAPEMRVELADMRYSLGMKAFTDRDYEKAADWLGRLLPDISLVRLRAPDGSGLPEPQASEKRRYAVFCLGEACEKTEKWKQAAQAYERLAVPGVTTEEVALFKLVRCYANVGDQTGARDARERLEERFPDSPYTRAVQGAR